MEPRTLLIDLPRGAFLVPAAHRPEARQQHVAGADGNAQLALRRLKVLAVDAVGPLQPIDPAQLGDVQEHATAHNPVLQRFDRQRLRALGGRDEVGGPSVVKHAVAEHVRQAVHVGDGEAVIGDAEEVAGGLKLIGLGLLALETLAAACHEVQRGHVEVDLGRARNQAGAGDGHPVLDQRGGVASRASGVMRLTVPSSSSSPQRPQLLHESM